MQFSRVGIRDAKINLSKYLKMVQDGVEVIITDRGRPVGKIVPVKNKDLPLADRVKRPATQGLLTAPSKQSARKIPPPIPLAECIAQKYLQQDRDDE